MQVPETSIIGMIQATEQVNSHPSRVYSQSDIPNQSVWDLSHFVLNPVLVASSGSILPDRLPLDPSNTRNAILTLLFV